MADLADRSTTAAPNGHKKKPSVDQSAKAAKPQAKKSAKPKQEQSKKKTEDSDEKGITTKKADDLADWYMQVLRKGEFLEYSDVPGCFILPPNSWNVWENIQAFLNSRFKKLGVRNCSFPLLIAKKLLETEKEHLEGFEAEVAWVTQGGKDKLPEPYAIRPTSETSMYGYYAKKIRSHRDLPLRWNQWNNVIRWEFKDTMPFIRSREFWWQEGHTAHLTEAGAYEEVYQILDDYAAAYEELLAVPVVKGRKTDNEKFPGADTTTTVEGFIPATGRGIQGATSHCLGQHFSKMFNITVEDPSSGPDEKKPPLHVWQNSWGFTTRSMGVMVLVHSDDKGLVIPPRVAEIQTVIVPVGVTAKTTAEDKEKLYKEIAGLAAVLEEAGVRVETDLRDTYSPGWKFNDWELKGVPLRIEFGPKDSAKHVVTTSRRDAAAAGLEKDTVPITEIKTAIPALLEQIQTDLFTRAKAEFDAHRVQVTEWAKFVPALDGKNLVLIPHCLGGPCEDRIKELSKRQSNPDGNETAEDSRAPSMGAKSLCIPFDQPSTIKEGETKCTNPECANMAKQWVMFGRSY